LKWSKKIAGPHSLGVDVLGLEGWPSGGGAEAKEQHSCATDFRHLGVQSIGATGGDRLGNSAATAHYVGWVIKCVSFDSAYIAE